MQKADQLELLLKSSGWSAYAFSLTGPAKWRMPFICLPTGVSIPFRARDSQEASSDGFQVPVIVHPPLTLYVAQNGDAAGAHERQLEDLPLIGINIALL